MKLKVQYTAQLRTAVGRSEEEVELPESCSLIELLRRLATRWDRAAQAHLFAEDGQLQRSLLIVHNGLAHSISDAGDLPLRGGDIITLLPPVAGG